MEAMAVGEGLRCKLPRDHRPVFLMHTPFRNASAEACFVLEER